MRVFVLRTEDGALASSCAQRAFGASRGDGLVVRSLERARWA